MTQLLVISSARIKLKNRHLLEWQTLSSIQQDVWALVSEEAAQKLALCGDDQVGCFYLKKEQRTRLTRIMVSQRHEREQMTTRHSNELLLLE